MRGRVPCLLAATLAACSDPLALVPKVEGAQAFVLITDQGERAILWAQDLSAGAPARQTVVAAEQASFGFFYERSLAELAWPADESAFNRAETELEPLPSPVAGFRLELEASDGPWIEQPLDAFPILKRALFPKRRACERVQARIQAMVELPAYSNVAARSNGELLFPLLASTELLAISPSEQRRVATDPPTTIACLTEGADGRWWVVGGGRVWRGDLSAERMALEPVDTSTRSTPYCSLWEDEGRLVLAGHDGSLTRFDPGGPRVLHAPRAEGNWWPVRSVLLPDRSRVVVGLAPLANRAGYLYPTGYHLFAQDGSASYYALPDAVGVTLHPRDGAWIATDGGAIYPLRSSNSLWMVGNRRLSLARLDALGATVYAPDSGPAGLILDGGERCEFTPTMPAPLTTFLLFSTPTGVVMVSPRAALFVELEVR